MRVGEPRKSYLGENSFPLILQNIHRYFFYIAVIFIFLLSLRRVAGAVVHRSGDAARTSSASASARIVLAVNVVLLASYTFGCHSGRHIFGGRKDEVSKSPMMSACYDCATGLNTAAHAVCVDEPVLGRAGRRLRAAVLDGDLSDWRIL